MCKTGFAILLLDEKQETEQMFGQNTFKQHIKSVVLHKSREDLPQTIERTYLWREEKETFTLNTLSALGTSFLFVFLYNKHEFLFQLSMWKKSLLKMSLTPVFFYLIFTFTVGFFPSFFWYYPSQAPHQLWPEVLWLPGEPLRSPPPPCILHTATGGSFIDRHASCSKLFSGFALPSGEAQSPWPGVHGICKLDSNLVGSHLCHFLAVWLWTDELFDFSGP